MKTLLFDRLGRLLSFTILHVMIGMIGHIQSSALLDGRFKMVFGCFWDDNSSE